MSLPPKPNRSRPSQRPLKGTLVGFRVPPEAASSEAARRFAERTARRREREPSRPRATPSAPRSGHGRTELKQTLLGGITAPEALLRAMKPVAVAIDQAKAEAIPPEPVVIPPEPVVHVRVADAAVTELTGSDTVIPVPVTSVSSTSSALPAARPYEAEVRPEPAPAVRMNAWSYRLALVGGSAATLGLLAASRANERIAELLPSLLWIPLVPTVLAQCVFVYKMWAAIDDRRARTTPGRAVALLFVPGFNLYWAYHVFVGFAHDYNAYLARHGLSAPRLVPRHFLAALLLPGIGVLIFWHLVGQICDGIRAIAR